MSGTMLLGVLRMPFGLAMATPTAQIQYHQRGVQAADEIEKLTRERDEARSKETDYREGFQEGWDAAHEGAAAVVEKLREALKFYAHQYCELGEAFEGCGKLSGDQCGGCLARAALEAKS